MTPNAPNPGLTRGSGPQFLVSPPCGQSSAFPAAQAPRAGNVKGFQIAIHVQTADIQGRYSKGRDGRGRQQQEEIMKLVTRFELAAKNEDMLREYLRIALNACRK